MIWQNPFAWLGLATLAVPLLVHLLGRRSARAQKFPSLRFLEASQLTATRLTRLTDLPLLAVRMGILAAAAAALAAPLLLTENRERDLGRALARAIIVDTSASMSARPVAGVPGGTGLDAARRESLRLAEEARTSVVLHSRAPAASLAGAAAWLERQHGRRELVIISDFQAGTVDSSDIARIPAEIGVALTRMETSEPTAPMELVTQRGDEEIIARVAPEPSPPASIATATTTVEWTVRPAAADSAPNGLVILAGAAERLRAEAARTAASTLAAVIVPADRPVAIVHRGFEGRAELVREAESPSQPWQAGLIARLRRDSTLIAAASLADLPSGGADSAFDASGSGANASTPRFTVIVRARDETPLVFAATDRPQGRDRILLFSRVDAGSLTSAALLAALARASAPHIPVTELEPDRIPESVLAGWRRAAAPATSTRTADRAGSSDGRWFWLVALLLLGIEAGMRRGRRAVKALEVARERAA